MHKYLFIQFMFLMFFMFFAYLPPYIDVWNTLFGQRPGEFSEFDFGIRLQYGSIFIYSRCPYIPDGRPLEFSFMVMMFVDFRMAVGLAVKLIDFR